jgi:hypothetical protein
MTARTLRIELAVESDEELADLRAALVAARATQVGEMRRRDARRGFGYGTASQQESMSAEAAQARRRADLLDRLEAAIRVAAGETAG